MSSHYKSAYSYRDDPSNMNAPPDTASEAWAHADDKLNHLQANIRKRKVKYQAPEHKWFYSIYGAQLLIEALFIRDEIRHWKSEHQLPIQPFRDPDPNMDPFDAAQLEMDRHIADIRHTEGELSRNATFFVLASFQRRTKYWAFHFLREMRWIEEKNGMRRNGRGRDRSLRHREHRRVRSRDRGNEPKGWFKRLANLTLRVKEELQRLEHPDHASSPMGNDAAYRDGRAIFAAGLINAYSLFREHKNANAGNTERGRKAREEAKDRRQGRSSKRDGARDRTSSPLHERRQRNLERSDERRRQQEQHEAQWSSREQTGHGAGRAGLEGENTGPSNHEPFESHEFPSSTGKSGTGQAQGVQDTTNPQPSPPPSKRPVSRCSTPRPSAKQSRRRAPTTSTRPAMRGSADSYYSPSYADDERNSRIAQQSNQRAPSSTSIQESIQSAACDSQRTQSRTSRAASNSSVSTVMQRSPYPGDSSASKHRASDDNSSGDQIDNNESEENCAHSSQGPSRNGSVRSFETGAWKSGAGDIASGDVGDFEELTSEVGEDEHGAEDGRRNGHDDVKHAK